MQSTITRLMLDPNAPNALLAVFRTGQGKSHIIRMLGTLQNGICAVFIPLLSLSADVMKKFQSACQLYGSVRAYHLDEIYEHSCSTYETVLERCQSLPPHTTSTIFLFSSPQHLCKSTRGLQTLLQCSEVGTLRQVVMDEVHLHVDHGLSFREDVRKLKDIFFLPVFQPRQDRQFKPSLLALTATMTKSLYPGLEYLTACKFIDDPRAIQLFRGVLLLTSAKRTSG
jgi:superfamily II DNA helicase RecQ